MQKDNREDISSSIEYMSISFIGNKTKAIIIGGGRAGFIKAKSFLSKGCLVYVLSPIFYDGFEELKGNNRFILIRDSYKIDYILDKHVVIIATGDEKIDGKIIMDCDGLGKIYLTCDDYSKGLFITPTQGNTKSVHFSINTKSGSPKTSLFLRDVLKEELFEFDEFVDFVCGLRKKINDKELKREIMEFVNTKDFYYFFKLGKHIQVLNMFYGGDKVEF